MNRTSLVSYFYRHRTLILTGFLLVSSLFVWIQYTSYFQNTYHDKSRHYHERLLDQIKDLENHRLNTKKFQLKKTISKNETKNDNNKNDKHVPNLVNADLFYQRINEFKLRHELINQANKKADPPDKFVNVTADMIELINKLERIIHIDLKGAPPKIDYFKEFIPLIKKFGATGILMEYEDMFPFKGKLKAVRHGNAYSENDVKLILKLAEENKLTVMPLVQTYGHLEWLLKHKNFAHLRENSEFPQVITPCIEESYDVIFDMLDQVIALHPNVPYFHIGCDEVYYKLVNDACLHPKLQFNGDFTEAFLTHIIRVAEHIHSKIPNVRIIIWNDMMNDLTPSVVKKFKPFIDKYNIEPMIWAYVENVLTWYQPFFFMKYGEIFPKIWASSAYKGSSGELTTLTSIRHHYLNQLTWNQQIYNQMTANACNFTGIAITGWSRYDHFLQVCDLLLQAIPSLVFTLKAAQLGEITRLDRFNISRQLGCWQTVPWSLEDIHDGYMTCSFPGHEVYEALLPLQSIFADLKENIEFAKKYISPISFKYNYVHKSRAKEAMTKLHFSYNSLVNFKKNFIEACQKFYWEDTINEWLEVYFMPKFNELYEFMNATKELMKKNDWLPRPLPITIKDHPESV